VQTAVTGQFPAVGSRPAVPRSTVAVA
jgi:hypothetical protein